MNNVLEVLSCAINRMSKSIIDEVYGDVIDNYAEALAIEQMRATMVGPMKHLYQDMSLEDMDAFIELLKMKVANDIREEILNSVNAAFATNIIEFLSREGYSHIKEEVANIVEDFRK